MRLSKLFPYLTAGFSIVVGLFFIYNTVFEASPITVAAAKKPVMQALSLVFIALGLVFFYLLYRGHLKQKGITERDIRINAVAKMTSKQLLADIALKEDDAEIQKIAKQRLQELKND